MCINRDEVECDKVWYRRVARLSNSVATQNYPIDTRRHTSDLHIYWF